MKGKGGRAMSFYLTNSLAVESELSLFLQVLTFTLSYSGNVSHLNK